MGNSGSALTQCIQAVENGRLGFAGYPNTPLYQTLWVKPYNLDIKVIPAAVVRPETADDISGIIKCAVTNSVPVQAKSGGHSYGCVSFMRHRDHELTVPATLGSAAMMAPSSSTWSTSSASAWTTPPGRPPLVRAPDSARSRRSCTTLAAEPWPTASARAWASAVMPLLYDPRDAVSAGC